MCILTIILSDHKGWDHYSLSLSPFHYRFFSSSRQKYLLPCYVFVLISDGIYGNEYISLLCLRDKVLKGTVADWDNPVTFITLTFGRMLQTSGRILQTSGRMLHTSGRMFQTSGRMFQSPAGCYKRPAGCFKNLV